MTPARPGQRSEGAARGHINISHIGYPGRMPESWSAHPGPAACRAAVLLVAKRPPGYGPRGGTMEISPAKRVGRILELLRNDVGKTQAEVAKEAHCDHTYISHIEKGNKRAHIETVRAIGKALGHQKAIEEIWGFAGVAETSATAELLAGYEAEAVRISTWTTTVFHALLQTEPYARAVIRTALPFESDAVVDELVA